jgi:hypothetical protein
MVETSMHIKQKESIGKDYLQNGSYYMMLGKRHPVEIVDRSVVARTWGGGEMNRQRLEDFMVAKLFYVVL